MTTTDQPAPGHRAAVREDDAVKDTGGKIDGVLIRLAAGGAIYVSRYPSGEAEITVAEGDDFPAAMCGRKMTREERIALAAALLPPDLSIGDDAAGVDLGGGITTAEREAATRGAMCLETTAQESQAHAEKYSYMADLHRASAKRHARWAKTLHALADRGTEGAGERT